MNTKRTNEHSVTEALPEYEIITKDGKKIGPYESAERAAWWARSFFPAEEQDPDRTGKGWDVQVVS